MSFTVNFENHYSTLVSALSKFRKDQKFQDVCFLADSEKIYVNRTILAVYSPYMEQILNELNNTTVVFVAHGISAKSMNQLIDFMYRGIISVTQEDVMPLINAAKIYHIVGLKDCTFTQSEVSAVKQQLSCTTPLHHPHPQTSVDPSPQKIQPSSFAVSQVCPRCPSQTISSQPLELKSAASTCLPHRCCPHISPTPRVTITSTSTAPSNASLACSTLLASVNTVTPTAVEPGTSSLGTFECSTNCHLHQQEIGPVLKQSPNSVSNNRSENSGDADTSTKLEPVAVHSSSSSTDRLPSQSATVPLSVSQVSSCCSTPMANAQSISSASCTPKSFSNRRRGKDFASCESPPVKASRDRKYSPLEIRKRHSSPAPSERKDQSIAPNTQNASDSLTELEELATKINSSSSEGDDVINNVLDISDSELSETSTSHVKSMSPRGDGSKESIGSKAAHYIPLRYRETLHLQKEVTCPLINNSSAEESRTVSAYQWSNFENSCVSNTISPHTRLKANVKEQYRGVGRLRGRRRGRS